MEKPTSLNLTDARERRLSHLNEDWGENTNARAIDQAARHYRRSKEDVEELADELGKEWQEKTDRLAQESFVFGVRVAIEVT